MLSTKTIENIKKAIAKYPGKKFASMDALMIVQQECGYLTEEALRQIADMLDMTPVQLNEVAAF